VFSLGKLHGRNNYIINVRRKTPVESSYCRTRSVQDVLGEQAHGEKATIRITGILDFAHSPVFPWNQQSRCLLLAHPKTEINPVSETLFCLEYRVVDKVKKIIPSVVHDRQK
jgi:hypothetical protein